MKAIIKIDLSVASVYGGPENILKSLASKSESLIKELLRLQITETKMFTMKENGFTIATFELEK